MSGSIVLPEFEHEVIDSNIRLTWAVPNDVDDAVQLTIEVMRGSDEWEKISAAKLRDGEVSISGLKPGHSYDFRVTVDPESGYHCPEDKLVPSVFIKRKFMTDGCLWAAVPNVFFPFFGEFLIHFPFFFFFEAFKS